MGRRFVDMRTVQMRMAGLDLKRQRETRRRVEVAMADSALPAPAKELPSPDVIAKVLLGGDPAGVLARRSLNAW